MNRQIGVKDSKNVIVFDPIVTSHVIRRVTPVEFRGDLWHKKTRVPGLSCGVVFVILRLAILVEHRLVMDGQTDGHRDMASTADA